MKGRELNARFLFFVVKKTYDKIFSSSSKKFGKR